jgi:hypothetical protein
LEDFWNISMTSGTYRYYDGCLYMMGLLHVTGNFKAYLSGSTVITPSSSISPTTATFDKYDPKDISVTMTLNGNTFVRIQNGTTTLTSGTHYTENGNTVTLKKEYFAARSVGTTTLTFVFSAGSNRTLTVSVVDTTPSTTISPETATFDKKTDLQEDITVTMNLYGNTFDRIQNEATTLTSGTHYTVSGNTVTLKSSYLAAQPVGTTTLTFYFSGGVSRTISITIKETTEGGGGTGDLLLEYTFDTNPTVKFGPSGSTSTAVRAVNGGSNVLEVTLTAKNDVLVLPFNLGSTTLADYSGIYVEVMAKSGDAQYKNFVVQIPKAGETTFGSGGNNTEIGRQSGNALEGNGQWKTHTITFNSNASASLTGSIELAFWVPETNPPTVYQIRALRLVAK